jgi:PTS system nitrogen regulatory IIA component
MKLTDILAPSRVVYRLEANEPSGLLRELVVRGFLHDDESKLGPDDEDRVVRILEERERLGSTGIKDGLAIPHGKLEDLQHLTACLGLHDDGLDFGALDQQPSRIFIVLLAPQGGGGAHLKALARISRLFADGSLQRRLLDAPDPAAIFEEVATEDARY